MSVLNRDWINSIWKAVRSNEGIDWADFEWYALDQSNAVAMLTSAGPGPILRSVFRDLDSYIAVVEFFHNVPPKGPAKILRGYPRVEDWQDAAERGMYAFDYMIEERDMMTGNFWDWLRSALSFYPREKFNKGYRAVALPAESLRIDELPAWVRQWLDGVKLSSADFRDPATVLNLSAESAEWL